MSFLKMIIYLIIFRLDITLSVSLCLSLYVCLSVCLSLSLSPPPSLSLSQLDQFFRGFCTIDRQLLYKQTMKAMN